MGIIDLPIPKVRDELSLHRVGSWEEETVDPNAAWNPSSQKSREPSLSSHAVAFGSFVYGVSQSSSRVDSWVTWKTSFAPYRVCRVVSNHDGSIIVCSTDAGTVALLRGVDGSVLATRKVAVEEDGILPAAHLSFIGRSITNQTTDAVVLGVPNNDPSKPELEFLMVSNIDSVALNDRDQLKVAEAARKMAIKSSLELQRSESGDILAFCGCFVGSDRIRFLTIDAQETIAVLDYSMTNSQLEVVQETVDWKILKEHKDAAVDVDLGLRLCGFKNDKETSLVLFCSLDNGSGPTIHCFNPVELYMSGSFQNEATNAAKKSREKVLAIEALTSPLPESAVAIAVASRSDDGAVIRVLQAGIVNGFLENSHVVYTVPVSDSLRSISMAPILSPNCGPYSFCYKVWQGSENYVCKAFSTPSGGSEGLTLGRIRLMIQSEQFDEADHLIMKIGENALIKDPHAKFHPSEVAVGRLRQILQQGNVCKEESLTQAKVCFHRLSSGCISGNERAGSNLLEAAESIARWATPNDSRTAPSLDEIMTALSAVVKTISEVLKILPHERHPPFEEKKKMMEAQLTALKYLSSVVPEDPEEAFHFTRRFQGSRSPGELFANFVARGCFKYAENMLKSYLRPQITASVAVESILRVQQEADPRSYISLLEELVMPSLCINHELLPSVWIWACRLADDLDDSDRINDAIFLLESVERGTDELQLRIHSSFASFSPFVERNAARKPRLADRKDYSNTEVSFASASSSPVVHENSNNDAVDNETNLPVPTVLERGRIKGGATKARQMSRSLHKLKRATGEDCEEVSETFLRGKLMHALCLKAARELGLERRVAKLRSFSDFGSIQNFAKELVRSLSMSFGNHHERAEMFSKDFKSFCEHFDVDFDKALLEYTQQLCSSTIASERTIQEAASVAQCCLNVSKKCECVLIVLRAALFCGLSPLWLKGLSKEAVEWATRDLTLRSELVEASRLLLVDGIVRRYIGNEGCTMFRVDNPRHAINLLEFVCQHYHQASVLTDALDIADAFNHLSRLDAGTNICEQAILGGDIDICTTTCERLYEIDAILADGVCTRLVAYCSELVAECADATGKDNVSVCRLDKLKQHALNASVTACTVISTAFAHTNSMTSESLSMNPYTKVDFASLEASKKHFQVIQYLQKEFSFFGLTLSDIRRGPQKLLKAGASLLEPVIKEYIQGDRKSWSVQLAKAKRASSLLADAGHCPEKEFWCALVATVTSPLKWPYDDGRCLDCLGDLGVLASFRDATAVSARTILSTAFSLCVKASSVAKRSREGFFNNFGRAVSLLQDYCLVCCPKNLLLQSQGLCTLAETVWHITLRGDEGSGERLESFRKILLEKCWTLRDPKTTLQSTNEETMPELPALCRPNLHASWYIGDGLLLPPSDSITRSVKFSKELMACLTSNTHKFGLGGISEIAKFLCSRGALSTALRLLLNSSVILLCSRVSGSTYNSIGETIQEVVTEGASRYVGGSGNGITSKIVDSEHAVCFLLSLPIKVAFKVYRSALPTAMKTRDYPRVLALANIGVVTGTGSPGSSVGKNLNVAWKKQDKFAQQCEQLGNKAYWWVFLKKHNIDFDSRRFDDDAKSGGTMNSAYAIYLITPIIAKMLLIKQYESAGDMVQDILDIVTRFAQTFGVKGEKVVECFVEYILSSPYSDCVENSDEDVRLHLPVVDLSVRSLLPTLQPIMRRAIALRRCVLNLEKDKNSGKDYDRHSLVLNLYRRTLYEISERDDIIRNVSSAILDAELEAIDRRCDALAILASVFEGERESDRPPFPDFFPPLPADITSASDYASLTANCSILGNSDGDGPFDPLKPLEEVLMRTYDMNTSMALAPLCFPLGLPNGYIHARFLMEHFRLASSQDSTMPSFDTDMRPVFSRIQSSGDKAMLAEWCSGFFKDNDQERLNCLELALNCAIKFSSEVEQRKNRYLDSKRKEPKTLELLEKEELTALETVQRLSQAKSSLSDKITVTKALLGATVVDNTVSKATEELLKRVSEALWKPQQEDCPAPEKVFEVLLSEASLLAATCSLGKTPFSIRQFQQMTSLCSEACQALADEHSHIHTAAIVDTMVRSWLFQGDDLGDEREPQSKKPLVGSSLSMKPSKTSSTFDDFEEEEEDTINFVMDLSAIQDPQDEEPLYCDEIERGGSISKKKMTSDEEPSALKKSSRESTEEMAKRVGLRVAFVMACDSLAQVPHSDEEKVAGDENCSLNANTNSVRSVGKKKAGGLLARIEKDGSKQNAYVLECARDLLQIVFAKSDIQCKSRIFAMPERTINQTVTFSMRHRALRAASILVPQDVLEKVIKEEGYLDETSTESLCSLKRCSFGIFVAKECEQIGMPLSHSDLGHISSMNFSSYARTLWRHFRDGDLKGSKGRLLLLLLEMSLKDTSEIDTAFVEVLLKEMGRLYLPRTIILACECIISLKGTKAYSSLLSTCPDTLNAAVVTSAKAILSEFHGLAKSESLPEEAPKEALLIVRRLGRVVQAFCDSDGGQSNLCHFIGVLASVCQGRSNDFLTKEIAGVISNSLRRVTCQEDRERLVTKIRGVQRLNDFCHFYDASL